MSEEADELTRFAQSTVDVLLVMARAGSMPAFKSYFIGAIIGNVVGNMTDEDWAEFQKPQAPCGHPGCDCHTVNIEIVKAMGPLRESHKAFLKKVHSQ